MNKIEIFGCSTDQRFDHWNEKFEKSYDDGAQMLFQSKETFHHDEDDGFCFNYKFCVQFTDYSQYCESDGIGYELMMVIMPNSLHESHVESLCHTLGVSPDEIKIADIICNMQASIRFGSDMCEDLSEVDKIMLKIAHVFECMNGLRGFYLDKYWNRIGSTGWDIIDYATNGADLFQPAFERYFEKQKIA